MKLGLALSIFCTSSRAVRHVKEGLPLDPARLPRDPHAADWAVTCVSATSLGDGEEVRCCSGFKLFRVSPLPGQDRGEEERIWAALRLSLPDLAR